MADRDVKIRIAVVGDRLEVIDQTGKKIADLGKTTENLGTQGAAGFSKFGASVVSLNQALDLVGRVGRTAVDFIGSSVKAASDAERQVNLLNQTLRSTGQYTPATSKALQGIAADLQRVTTFSDEAVLAVERQLAPLNLSEKQMRRTSEAVLDLSIRFDRSAESIARMVGRGNFEALGKLGIHVDKAADSGTQLNQVLDSTARIAGGQARAATEGLQGSTTQLANAYDDLQEAVGNVLVNSDALPGLYQTIKGELITLTDETNKWAEANRGAIDVSIKEFGDDFSDTLTNHVIPTIQETKRELELLKQVWDGLTGYFGGAAGALSVFLPANFRDVTAGASTTSNVPRPPGFVGPATPAGYRPPPASNSTRPGDPVASTQQIADGWAKVQETINTRVRPAVAGFDADTIDASKSVGEITREFERTEGVVFNLGTSVNRALSQGLTGNLAGGPFSILQGAGKAIATEFIGGLLEAQLAKNAFDVKVTENFTVTLPGAMAEGASLMSDAWSSALDLLGIETTQTITDIAKTITSTASQTSDTVTALARNSGSSLSGGSVVDAYGTKFSGAGAGDFVSSSGATLGAGGGGGGIGAAGVAGLAALGAYIYISGITESIKQANKAKGVSDYQRVTDANVASAAFSGLFSGGSSAVGLEGIGGPLGKLGGRGIEWFEKQGKVGDMALASINPALSVAIHAGAFQAPTRGSIERKSTEKIAREAGLYEPGWLQGGGHSGFRAAGIQLNPNDATRQQWVDYGLPNVNTIDSRNPRVAAQVNENMAPGVNDLRYSEGFAIGAILGEGLGDAVTIANNLTNTIGATGVSAKEAERQMLKFADAAGINLANGIEELNQKAQAGVLNADQLARGVGGLADLFLNDLPKGVDATKIAINSMVTTTTGQILLDMEQFEKKLSRQSAALARVPGDVERGKDFVEQTKYQELNPWEREGYLDTKLAGIDQQLATGIDPMTGKKFGKVKRVSLLEEREQVGEQYVGLAQDQYAPGSLERDFAIDKGLGIVETSTDRLDRLGRNNTPPGEKNTKAVEDNTAAIKENTAAQQGNGTGQSAQRGGEININIEGGGGNGGLTAADVAEIVKDMLHSNASFRHAIKVAVHNG